MKRSIAAVLLSALLFSGCAGSRPEETAPPEIAVNVEEVRQPAAFHADAVVARMEEAVLTNEALQDWYRAEVAQYRQSGTRPAPDFDLPLEEQPCPAAENGKSWQQFFLERALNRWHTAQALIRHSRETPLPTEAAYRGNPDLREKYMDGMPAASLLYAYDLYYQPNSLHQAFLDTVEGEMAYDLNYAYMYFTTLTYALEEEETAGTGEPLVTFRHILLTGEEDAVDRGTELLTDWAKGRNASESTFAQLASLHSRDEASAKSGGLYRNVRREQLPPALAQWCFDENRQEGDTALIPVEEGVHLLYFSGLTHQDAEKVRRQAGKEARLALLEEVREGYPLQVDWDSVELTEGEGASLSDLLYPDIAHERFPEVPLYLQQDYLGTMYGDYKLTTNGCGITSLAMLASYMTDEELTPPALAARYGRYSRSTGTSASLFEDAPPQLGFYLLKKTWDWREAREYMEQGCCVVVCQHKGYWTRGGHYLVLEKLTEEGLVQVRDSNMANYSRLSRHKDDAFPWDTISPRGSGYWIFEKKVTASPACTRCGDPEGLEQPLVTGYLCGKCGEALLRREAFLDGV